MNTRPDPDLASDFALVEAYDSSTKDGLSIAEIEVSTDDISAVRRACENAEWTGFSVRSHPNVECAVVTCVFDPMSCEIEDIADALRHITNESTTVADEREAPAPCGDCGRPIVWSEDRQVWRHAVDPERGCFLVPAEVVSHRAYRTEADPQTRKIRSVCGGCGWRSDWTSNGGLAGAAHDAHVAEVSK